MGAEIRFVDRKLRNEYESLKDSAEFAWLYKALTRAFEDIMEKPSCGIPLKKYRVPKDLKSLDINNLWKYDLPGGWRLLYSLAKGEIRIISLILEWCDHHTYEKKYRGRR